MNKKAVLNLTVYASLIALMIVFAFTPIGYLKFGIIEITFMCIPVIAGIVFGQSAGGALLGLVFALTSFAQCFGMSAFGVAIYAISPIKTIILLFVPRILMGYFSGNIYSSINKALGESMVSKAALSLSAPILNTLMFVLLFVALFKDTDYFIGLMDSLGSENVWGFVVSMFGINAVCEATLCTVVGIPLCTVLEKMKARGFRK